MNKMEKIQAYISIVFLKINHRNNVFCISLSVSFCFNIARYIYALLVCTAHVHTLQLLRYVQGLTVNHKNKTRLNLPSSLPLQYTSQSQLQSNTPIGNYYYLRNSNPLHMHVHVQSVR
jgi:hypothetical protein